MIDMEVKERFIELRAKGYSYARISRTLHVSKPTLLKWTGELSGQLAEAKIIQLDTLVAKFKLGKAHRIKFLADVLREVESELVARPMIFLSADKLVKIFLAIKSDLVQEINSVSKKYQAPLETGDTNPQKSVTISALD